MRIFILAFVFSISLVAYSQEAAVQTAESFIADIMGVAEFSRAGTGASSPESQQKIGAASAKVDFVSLAQKSFGALRWKKFATAEREDFLKSFRELLEVVAYPKAKKFSARKESLKYKKLPKAGQVQILGQIEREKKGEVVQQKMELILFVDTKSQKITDAVIEGELLSSNLRRQFDQALKKKSFAQIIAQMKKRVEEAKKPKAGQV